MKKSEIYKMALAAMVKEIANGIWDTDETYYTVKELCDKIDMELYNERREAGERA